MISCWKGALVCMVAMVISDVRSVFFSVKNTVCETVLYIHMHQRDLQLLHFNIGNYGTRGYPTNILGCI